MSVSQLWHFGVKILTVVDVTDKNYQSVGVHRMLILQRLFHLRNIFKEERPDRYFSNFCVKNMTPTRIEPECMTEDHTVNSYFLSHTRKRCTCISAHFSRHFKIIFSKIKKENLSQQFVTLFLNRSKWVESVNLTLWHWHLWQLATREADMSEHFSTCAHEIIRFLADYNLPDEEGKYSWNTDKLSTMPRKQLGDLFSKFETEIIRKLWSIFYQKKMQRKVE